MFMNLIFKFVDYLIGVFNIKYINLVNVNVKIEFDFVLILINEVKVLFFNN